MWRSSLVTLIVLVWIGEALSPTRLNNAPVIGIVTLPVGTDMSVYDPTAVAYFAASYVKFVEMAGARVVPIQFNAAVDDAEGFATLLGSINGVLFTGGDDLDADSPYYTTSKAIIAHSFEQAQNGVIFPIWGSCLGFETITTLISGDASLLTQFDAENLSLPLKFTHEVKESEMFCKHRPNSRRVEAIFRDNVTLNNHNWGVKPTDFYGNDQLSTVFRVLATSNDRQGAPFVALVEGINVPIYGSQFHPEKALFEWLSTEAIGSFCRGY